MSQHCCTGALMRCSFGAAPASFTATPRPVMTSRQVAGTIMDHAPMLNIPGFGPCSSLGNPQVASATAAAFGVLTPQPCVPNTPSPWVTGSPTVIVGTAPALNKEAMLLCIWGGLITFAMPGQFTEMVP